MIRCNKRITSGTMYARASRSNDKHYIIAVAVSFSSKILFSLINQLLTIRYYYIKKKKKRKIKNSHSPRLVLSGLPLFYIHFLNIPSLAGKFTSLENRRNRDSYRGGLKFLLVLFGGRRCCCCLIVEMPLSRYQLRNEYGLADPELYRAADKDDPEALLEGVAMAGLVGVLRQLGDLAELVSLHSLIFQRFGLV